MRAIHARGSGEAARRAKRGRQPSVTRVAICVSRVLLVVYKEKENHFLVLLSSIKVTLHETIRNDDFLRNTTLQHCCDIVSNGHNIVPTLQRCVVPKIVVANRLVWTAPGLQPLAFLPFSLPSPSSLRKLSCTKRTKTWSLQITIIFQQISVARRE